MISSRVPSTLHTFAYEVRMFESSHFILGVPSGDAIGLGCLASSRISFAIVAPERSVRFFRRNNAFDASVVSAFILPFAAPEFLVKMPHFQAFIWLRRLCLAAVSHAQRRRPAL